VNPCERICAAQLVEWEMNKQREEILTQTPTKYYNEQATDWVLGLLAVGGFSIFLLLLLLLSIPPSFYFFFFFSSLFLFFFPRRLLLHNTTVLFPPTRLFYLFRFCFVDCIRGVLRIAPTSGAGQMPPYCCCCCSSISLYSFFTFSPPLFPFSSSTWLPYYYCFPFSTFVSLHSTTELSLVLPE
jgi:hypothetical protein